MDYTVQGGRKESDTTERLTFSMTQSDFHKWVPAWPSLSPPPSTCAHIGQQRFTLKIESHLLPLPYWVILFYTKTVLINSFLEEYNTYLIQ